MALKYNPTEKEAKIIKSIAIRANHLATELKVDHPIPTAILDITICHCNGCPLRLLPLLRADDYEFAHDVFGINKHLDHKTGKLSNFFVPRFARD